MFAGSGIVSFNSLDLFDSVIAIDKCKELVRIHTWIANTPLEGVLSEIDRVIDEYNLSKDNKEGFLKLRELYNTQAVKGAINPVEKTIEYWNTRA